jgi:phosphoglycolate phosphatase-like HAD superfamily hydrolase
MLAPCVACSTPTALVCASCLTASLCSAACESRQGHRGACLPQLAAPAALVRLGPPLFDAVLLDLDGTLIDSSPQIVRSFEAAFAAMSAAGGLRARAPDAATIAAECLGEPLLAACARYTVDAASAGAMAAAHRAASAAAEPALAFAGVRTALARLTTAGVALAVVTSKSGGPARAALAAAGLAPYVSAVVAVDDADTGGAVKPSAAPALVALARLRVPAGPRVLFVGDAPADVLCGRAAGCATAAACWSTPAPPRAALEAAAPGTWLASPRDLVDAVLPSII